MSREIFKRYEDADSIQDRLHAEANEAEESEELGFTRLCRLLREAADALQARDVRIELALRLCDISWTCSDIKAALEGREISTAGRGLLKS